MDASSNSDLERVKIIKQNKTKTPAEFGLGMVVAHYFNLRTPEAETRGSLSPRSAWDIYVVRQKKQNSEMCQVRWFIPITLAGRRQRQEDSELQVRP